MRFLKFVRRLHRSFPSIARCGARSSDSALSYCVAGALDSAVADRCAAPALPRACLSSSSPPPQPHCSCQSNRGAEPRADAQGRQTPRAGHARGRSSRSWPATRFGCRDATATSAAAVLCSNDGNSLDATRSSDPGGQHRKGRFDWLAVRARSLLHSRFAVRPPFAVPSLDSAAAPLPRRLPAAALVSNPQRPSQRCVQSSAWHSSESRGRSRLDSAQLKRPAGGTAANRMPSCPSPSALAPRLHGSQLESQSSQTITASDRRSPRSSRRHDRRATVPLDDEQQHGRDDAAVESGSIAMLLRSAINLQLSPLDTRCSSTQAVPSALLSSHCFFAPWTPRVLLSSAAHSQLRCFLRSNRS